MAAVDLLCIVLRAVLYHWTGKPSRRTAESLRAGFGDQAEVPCQIFNAELTDACNELLPYDYELTTSDWTTIHRTPLIVIRGMGHNWARGIIRDLAHIEQYGRFIVQSTDQPTGLFD